METLQDLRREGKLDLIGVERDPRGRPVPATLGLAGLGNLGAAMVGPARAFGMETIAWSEHLSPKRATEAGARRVTKQELLAGADVLFIHLVLSERTRGLIGAAELAHLTELQNVVLLPHLGYVSEPAFRNMYGQAVENIAAFRDGAPIRTL